jgi:glucose/arabinose dehydrogenase/PKD repeat protein
VLVAAAVAAALAPTSAVVTVGAASVGAASAEAPAPAAAVPEVPAGFQDTIAIGNLSEPVAVAFAPDGTAFIGLKTGVIKTFDYDQDTGQFEPFADHVNVANLDVNVNNYWDRGLTGIAVDPDFGTAGNNYIYVNYSYNRDPRDPDPGVVPKWGDPGQQYDECSAPASMGPPVVTGCLVNIRVSRIPVEKQPIGWVASGPEEELVQGACMQFPSHASGDVAFGPDGYLYASAGDGASFDTEDYGQAGNPCPGDPVDEGGSLRSQDIRTPGDALSFSGSIIRIDKTSGLAADGTQDNASRIVAYGQRNPWRLTFRPGTSELWSGDVGGSLWEEINRLDMDSFTGPVNRGWPCYEGSPAGVETQPGWDALDKPICEGLYADEAATPGTVKPPYFSYPTRDGGPMTPGENCVEGTSSISGVAFIPPTSTYPAAYRGSLFFNDYARGCIWRLGKLPNGDPDPGSITPFVEAAETPVAVEVGPGGDLFYVDYGIVDGVPTGGAGDIHRIVYTPSNQAPVAALTANPTSGAAPLTVSFSAAGSTDADGDALTYEWALDGDGVFDDGGGATRSRTYTTPGSVTVQVRVSDGNGGSDTEQVVISPGNSPPGITGMSPSASLTWAVGDQIGFSATATDAQQSLPDSAFSWSLSIQHCPSVCHTHPIQTWVGQRTGSFQAPDHEYPSNLLLQVTVTDDQGLSDTETIQLDPESVAITFASNPTGAALTVAGNAVAAPHTQTFIQGSGFNVSAPATRQVGGANYSFTSWSDGGTATHAVVAPATPATLTASYTRQNRLPTVTVSANPTSGSAPLTVDFSANATDPDGDNAGFTYAWALDGDGVFDDGGGATKQKQYTTGGSRTVQVRVTDSHGGQATSQVYVASYEPVRRRVSFVTRPDGLEVKVDGKRRLDGWKRRFAVGESVKVAAPKRQWRDGVLFTFVRWSDDGARVHSFVVPESRLKLRAVYRRVRS